MVKTRRLPRIASALLLVLLSSLPAAAQDRVSPEAVGMSADRLDRLTSAMDDYVAAGRLPGAVVQVLRDGGLVYSRAFGHRDLESGDPQEVDDIFRIASQTKAIVSVAVMILQEEGHLLIGQPVGMHLPEYMETTVAEADGEGGYEVVPADRPITIRDLLTHTAGVGYGGNGPAAHLWAEAGIQGWYFADREEPVRETVRRLAELPFPSHPGDGFVYGYSTDILGALVEEVSGMPLDAFLQDRLFDPLDMRDTHFYLPPSKASRLTTVYGLRAGELTRAPDGPGMQTQGQYLDGPRTSFSGGAGLLSTARDYSRFLQMVLNGGELDGVRVLSPTTVNLMLQNHVGEMFGPANGMGLGFQTVRDLGARGTAGSAGEFGWGGAYHSTYWGDTEEGLVVVYFTQVIPAQGLDDHAKLKALVYQAITESWR